jgi:hypothetical protein
MWEESEAAIGDLLASETLRASRLDEPTDVSAWWADRGIAIHSDKLNREFLFELANSLRGQNDPDWVSLLWHVFAWGVVGDFRNVGAIAKRMADHDEWIRLNTVLDAAAQSSHRGEIRHAYQALLGTLPGLGPAFFTKFLYFTGNRNSAEPRCLILDSRVEHAVFTLTGLDFFKQTAATYDNYCRRIAQWSKDHGETADEIEFCLYRFGQRIDSRRWKWLRAEVSLYREGSTNVNFDNILCRLDLLSGKTK